MNYFIINEDIQTNELLVVMVTKRLYLFAQLKQFLTNYVDTIIILLLPAQSHDGEQGPKGSNY